jgi:hypothetical protein
MNDVLHRVNLWKEFEQGYDGTLRETCRLKRSVDNSGRIERVGTLPAERALRNALLAHYVRAWKKALWNIDDEISRVDGDG